MDSRRGFLFAIAICFSAMGAVVLAFFSAPFDKSFVSDDEPLIVKANEYKAQFFGYYSAYDNVVSFTVLNDTIHSCEPLYENSYLEWQAGRYMPSLSEMDHGVFRFEGSHVQYPMLGAINTRYLFFFNQDSYDKVVQWRVTAYWQEPNTTNLAIGAGLMIAGLGTALGLTLMHLLKPSPRFTISHIAHGRRDIPKG